MNPTQSLPRAAGPSNKDAAALSETCVRFSLFYRQQYVEELDFCSAHVHLRQDPDQRQSLQRALRRFPRATSILFPLHPFHVKVEERNSYHLLRTPIESRAYSAARVVSDGKLLRKPVRALVPHSTREELQHLSLDSVEWDEQGLTNLIGSFRSLRCVSIRHATAYKMLGSSAGRLVAQEALERALRVLPKTIVTLSLESSVVLSEYFAHVPEGGSFPPEMHVKLPCPFSGLAELPNLQELCLGYTHLGVANCAILAQLGTLTSLRLCCSSGRSRLSPFAMAISKMTRLQSLSVFFKGRITGETREGMCSFLESLPPTLIELTAVFGFILNSDFLPTYHTVFPPEYRMESLPPFCFNHCPLLRVVTLGLRGEINRPSWEHLVSHSGGL